MVLALVVPVLMLALLLGMDLFEEFLFGSKPTPPPPPSDGSDGTPPAIPEQPPRRPG
ncbi:hypothetical protein [Streptomyces brasiliensis]|uniref:Uncharacterized protein n=1 Tax=Streptomyces brasiliensis TaxID=1954 RepID=A0A917KS75_9ACTN|nr:hypothetical protein [Streptomyces brasiliensis]GGJ27533.1 hypothetical protein GCM10010121_043510 [Streptomyces brasiliensis]